MKFCYSVCLAGFSAVVIFSIQIIGCVKIVAPPGRNITSSVKKREAENKGREQDVWVGSRTYG